MSEESILLTNVIANLERYGSKRHTARFVCGSSDSACRRPAALHRRDRRLFCSPTFIAETDTPTKALSPSDQRLGSNLAALSPKTM
jgi:hypothetical protein